jgi:2-dehydropantoate 2-reductase
MNWWPLRPNSEVEQGTRHHGNNGNDKPRAVWSDIETAWLARFGQSSTTCLLASFVMTTRFHKIAVVGAGAVGSFYGAMLARAGQRVVLIGRPQHVEAIGRDGLKLDMADQVETLRVEASTELNAVHDSDLILFCVKSTDTDTLATELAPLLEPRAVVLSLQNGVENAATIARHVRQTVVPAVVYVATAMAGPGTVRHLGRGDLVIGALNADARHDPVMTGVLQDLVTLFGAAGVKVTISNDVMAELWSKLMVNCAYNAISALAQAPYARLAAQPEIREIQHAIVREVVVLAQAEGIGLQLEPSLKAMERIATAMPAQVSSTAQDMARRKPSEIDHLNGFVARRGRELRVPVPINQTLAALVKLVEAGYERDE